MAWARTAPSRSPTSHALHPYRRRQWRPSFQQEKASEPAIQPAAAHPGCRRAPSPCADRRIHRHGGGASRPRIGTSPRRTRALRWPGPGLRLRAHPPPMPFTRIGVASGDRPFSRRKPVNPISNLRRPIAAVSHMRQQVAAGALACVVALTLSAPARASGSSMPWEAPLQSILESIEGPVAKIIAVIVIIVTGLTLAFGDSGGGFRSEEHTSEL